MVERRTEWTRRARFDEVRRDLAERISRVVDPMPTAEFDALLRRMTLMQLKYETIDDSRV
jgi:hypothetical protein